MLRGLDVGGGKEESRGKRGEGKEVAFLKAKTRKEKERKDFARGV